jgi:hypothetical protein
MTFSGMGMPAPIESGPTVPWDFQIIAMLLASGQEKRPVLWVTGRQRLSIASLPQSAGVGSGDRTGTTRSVFTKALGGQLRWHSESAISDGFRSHA